MDDQPAFNAWRHSCMVAVVVLKTGDSVVLPEVFEVVVYLVIKTGRQWIVMPEPPQHSCPLMQFK